MNVLKNVFDFLKKPVSIIFVVVLVGGSILGLLAYRQVMQSPGVPPTAIVKETPTPTPTATATPKPATATAVPTPTPIALPVQGPEKIRGVDGDAKTNYTGINWVRTGYPTCGWGNLRGDNLKKTIQAYHARGIRVLLTFCQPRPNQLFDQNIINDVAAGNADAVQCGNEQMKQDASVSFLYVPPERFAKFYDMCERAVHKVRKDVPVLIGSLDPHIVNGDYQLLLGQVNYLDQMQNVINTSLHPGGNWEWRKQKLGLIDSWHNGYLGANNLYDLFVFWSQQIGVDLNSGELGKHLWVVEGTGCFRGCGVDENSAYAVAVSHIMSLITNTQTAKQYRIPIFYFSGKDFFDQGIYWPIGLLDNKGRAKPIRQDLPMGAIKLTLSCGNKSVTVQDQLQLLARLYSDCNPPDNYAAIVSG